MEAEGANLEFGVSIDLENFPMYIYVFGFL